MSPGIDRRTCLNGLMGAALALTALPMPRSRPAAEPVAALECWLRRGGADSLGDRTRLVRLGAAYLTNHPHEGDLRRLSQRLADDRSRPVAVQLIEHIARDWEAHHIVIADGWVLSRTEAHLCAALHLLDGAPA